MKYALAYAIVVLTACVVTCIKADEYPHVTNVENNYNTSDGMALGMAMSEIDFDSNVGTTQIGIGGAAYEDVMGNRTHGFAIGIGKRVCEGQSCGLIKFTGGANEGGGKGAGFGLMWNL